MVEPSGVGEVAVDEYAEYLGPFGYLIAGLGVLFCLFSHTLLQLLVIAIGFVAGVAAVDIVWYMLEPTDVLWHMGAARVVGDTLIAFLFNAVHGVAIHVAAGALGFAAASFFVGFAAVSPLSTPSSQALGSGADMAALAMVLTHYAKHPVVIPGTSAMVALMISSGYFVSDPTFSEIGSVETPTESTTALGPGGGAFLVGVLFQFWFYSTKRMERRAAKESTWSAALRRRGVTREGERATLRAEEYDRRFGTPRHTAA